MPTSSSSPTFEQLTAAYQNTAEHNDALHRELTQYTRQDPLLSEHRQHIEQNKLGFGDAAFHSMWRCLLTAAASRFGAVRALEIGVFKGQVVSLWSLLARELKLDVQVSAISPLAGQPLPRSALWVRFRYQFDRRFRARVDNGDFYADEDYEGLVRGLFEHFGLQFDRVTLHRALSTDPALLRTLGAERYHLIYVDGDHTFEGASHDFKHFGPKVIPGGWLVADDAGCDLPGTAFWKGHEAVSRAVRTLPSLGFRNVLNVGHNRVFERLA
jgi:predicted O-methyltransferase YrrM